MTVPKSHKSADKIARQLDSGRLARRLRREGARAGVAVDTARLTAVTRADAQIAIATVEGFENRPATELSGGVDFGFGYVSLPENTNVPDGFYRFRATSDGDPEVGSNSGRVELVREDGSTAARFEATFDVQSLEVPDDRPGGAVTEITAAVQRNQQAQIIIAICYLCPNGYIVCFVLVLRLAPVF